MLYVQKWYRGLILLVFVSILIGMLPMRVAAQVPDTQPQGWAVQLFLPLVNTPDRCAEIGFATSKLSHDQGKTLSVIAQEYLMNPIDLLAPNRALFGDFPDYAMKQTSAVCLPKIYSLYWNSSTGYFARVNSPRTGDWDEHLLNPPAQTASLTTDLYFLGTPTYPVGLKLFEIVGEWFAINGVKMGPILKVSVGSVGATLLKNSGTKLTLLQIAMTMGITTANAVNYPATGLGRDAMMFHYSIMTATGKVYPTCSNTAITEAEALNIPNIITLVVYESSGTSLVGCYTTAEAPSPDAIAYPWRVAEQGIIEMAVNKNTVDIAAGLIAALDDLYSSEREDRPVGADPTQGCEAIDMNYHWLAATGIVQAYVDFLMQNPSIVNDETKAEVIDIATSMVKDVSNPETFEQWFKSVKPRRHWAQALGTNQNQEANPLKTFNIHLECFQSSPVISFQWLLDIRLGGVCDCGVARRDEDIHFLLQPIHYPYPY